MMHALHQSWTCWSRYVSFLIVLEEGSLHRAAARPRISLPALSVQCRPRKRIRRRISPESGLVFLPIRPTVLLAAKTYGKGVLNPLFSSVFARVRAETPIFSKTCRRCMA
jgi:hypothetical protein